MEAIMNYQHAFFISGDETDLRPMILKYIAEATHLDISTISRWPTVNLYKPSSARTGSSFLQRKPSNRQRGRVSTREVKKILSDIIAEENKKHPTAMKNLPRCSRKKVIILHGEP